MVESKFLYVANHPYSSLTKVGVSKAIATRMKTIATAVGSDLTVHYESMPLTNHKEIELIVLRHFVDYRVRGEWFNIPPEKVIEFIKTTVEPEFNSVDYECIFEYLLDSQPIAQYCPNHTDEEKQGLTEVEDFIYEDGFYKYYVMYRQGILDRTVCFINRGIAKRFVTRYQNKLLKIK